MQRWCAAPARVWDRAIGAAARMQRCGGSGRAGAGDAGGLLRAVDPHLDVIVILEIRA